MSREQREKNKVKKSKRLFCSLIQADTDRMMGREPIELEGWDEAMEHDLLMQAIRDHDYPPDAELDLTPY